MGEGVQPIIMALKDVRRIVQEVGCEEATLHERLTVEFKSKSAEHMELCVHLVKRFLQNADATWDYPELEGHDPDLNRKGKFLLERIENCLGVFYEILEWEKQCEALREQTETDVIGALTQDRMDLLMRYDTANQRHLQRNIEQLIRLKRESGLLSNHGSNKVDEPIDG